MLHYIVYYVTFDDCCGVCRGLYTSCCVLFVLRCVQSRCVMCVVLQCFGVLCCALGCVLCCGAPCAVCYDTARYVLCCSALCCGALPCYMRVLCSALSVVLHAADLPDVCCVLLCSKGKNRRTVQRQAQKRAFMWPVMWKKQPSVIEHLQKKTSMLCQFWGLAPNWDHFGTPRVQACVPRPNF